MGSGSVSRARAALEKPRPELAGKPLIQVQEIPNPKGGKAYLEVTITDIWKDNINRFTPTSPVDFATNQRPETAQPTSRATSPVDIKKNLKKNNEEEQATFISELQSDPAYQRLDVGLEFRKADRWCAVNHRQLTPKFFVNWLNRIDQPFRPIDDLGNGNGNGHKRDAAFHARQAELARKLGREYRPDAEQS
jgi:hypothetical protein